MLLHIRPLARHFSQYTRLTRYERNNKWRTATANGADCGVERHAKSFLKALKLLLHIIPQIGHIEASTQQPPSKSLQKPQLYLEAAPNQHNLSSRYGSRRTRRRAGTGIKRSLFSFFSNNNVINLRFMFKWKTRTMIVSRNKDLITLLKGNQFLSFHFYTRHNFSLFLLAFEYLIFMGVFGLERVLMENNEFVWIFQNLNFN